MFTIPVASSLDASSLDVSKMSMPKCASIVSPVQVHSRSSGMDSISFVNLCGSDSSEGGRMLGEERK
jgi:hypothetical protein